MKNEKLSETVSSLHRLERAVLPFLEKSNSVSSIIEKSGMQEVEVVRAVNWLQTKGMAIVSETIEEIIQLGKNGKGYAKSKLPEVRFLNALAGGPQSLSGIKKAGLSDDEIGASIGALMRIKAIEPVPGAAEKTFKLAPAGKALASQGTSSQKLIEKKFPLKVSSLSEEEKSAVQELKKRKDVVEDAVIRTRTASLTLLGKEVASAIRKSGSQKFEDRITPEILKSGSWKNMEFRSYDLSAPVPRMFFGKAQPYREFLEQVREEFAEMGFEETTGPIVESEFWNMDALFMPQFHSARDIHDAYYVKEPKYAVDLPQELVKKVRAAHENGFGTGSRGWRYSFDEKKTARLVLRSQDTSISPRTLASAQLKVPGKYFQMVRCFRYDVIDATHLADFNQIGGFVIEEGLHLGHLISLLKQFARKFCNTDQVKVVPSYFPFTEPSAGLYAKHPQMGWIELAGAGMFRPEMVKPLVGKQIPVIAWGIGIDRVAMFNLGINDIRQLFSHDLDYLRNARVI
jgi:phenylalanyl-tRNA synthetase alpha chain